MTMNHPTTTAYLQGGSSGHILGYVDQVPVYLGYLLPKQDSGTSQITVNTTQIPQQMDHPVQSMLLELIKN